MHLHDGKWPDDPYCRARPIVKLNNTFYGIKQANRGYIEEVFHFIVDNLGLQASVVPPGHFFYGTLGKPNGISIPVYVDDIIIIGSLKPISSVASQLYDQFTTAGRLSVPDILQYLGMTVTQNRYKRSIANGQIGYINRILVRFQTTNGRKCST